MGTSKRPQPSKLARKLKQVRVNLGLSQSEMAKQLGVKDRASISLYENGKREPPLPTLLAYARTAQLNLESLIDDKMKLSDK